MTGLLRRLRDALRPDLEVRSELASGGMARVFLARDPVLERDVAVKVLRPELATAKGAERFLREARLLARVRHPNVVPVHEVGERAGLFYCVMERVQGPSLEERLAGGPLATEEALRVADGLLAALGAAHDEGVVHRDVKPANVILGEDGRVVLVDFGVAKAVADTDPGLTTPDARPGTPGWMAPEQLAGEGATPRTDLYAVARLAYEAITARSWTPGTEPGRADWSGVPRRIARVLERGLAAEPRRRWPDAGAFRSALARAGDAPRRWPTAAAALLLAVLLVAGLTRGTDGPAGAERARAYDLALVPCQSVTAADADAGADVARVASFFLENLPQLRVVPQFHSFRWWRSLRGSAEDPYRAVADALGARHVVRCTLEPAEDDRLHVGIEIHGAGGEVLQLLDAEAPAETPPVAAGNAMGLAVIRALRPRFVLSEEGHVSLAGHDREAVRAFLLGEHAFQHDARHRAAAYYEQALAIDPELSVARWRLVDLRRYLSLPGVEEDLEVLERSEEGLGPVDRLMLAARLAPPGPLRLERYRELRERYPDDSYALFTYGDELFHRGPLFGVGQDSALAVLRAAARRDSLLAPAYDHLALALIRAGRRDEAEAAIERLATLKGPDAEADLYHPEMLRHAWHERFEPAEAAERRPLVFGPGGADFQVLRAAARLGGPYLDLPGLAVALGAMVVDRTDGTADRAAGLVGQGLGEMAGGRVEEGLERLDEAASAHLGAEGEVHAALWRVLPPALGTAGTPPEQVGAGRDALRALAAEDRTPRAVRARAAWGLGLDAAARGDTVTARRWADRLDALAAGEAADRASAILDGWIAVAEGDRRAALERSAPALAYRSADRIEWPFLRSVLYYARGRWLLELGRLEEADRSLLWHEAVDLFEVPTGVGQAGEVDWALGTHADLLRLRIREELGDGAGACRLARRVAHRWRDPEPALAAAREAAEAVRGGRCP